MATTIVTKNSSVALSAPSAGQLVQGELAINVTDRKIYTLDGGGNVVLLAAGGSPYVTPQVIQVTDNTYPALRITQLGTAAALLVEDSANPDATPFVIDASGNVGIANSSPAGKLDVIGNTYLGGLRLNGANTSDTIYQATGDIGVSAASASNIKFNINNTERMRIDSSGRVGINVTPSTATTAQLQVTGGNTNATTLATSFSTATAVIYPKSSSGYSLAVASGTGDFPQLQVTAATGGSSGDLLIQPYGGSVGIGSSAPSTYGAKLAIYSAASSTANIQITNPGIGTGTIGLTAASSNFKIYNSYASATLASGVGIDIDTSGNVGIGTTSPTSALQTAGSSSKSAFKTPNIAEVNTVSATAATGTINYDVTTQSVLYYTTNASGNFTVNFRGSVGTSLNTVMQTGESISVTFLVTNGATAYYNSAIQVDGSSVTPKWQGGLAPTTGNASSIDSYTYVIIKTGSAAFTVLATQTKFA